MQFWRIVPLCCADSWHMITSASPARLAQTGSRVRASERVHSFVPVRPSVIFHLRSHPEPANFTRVLRNGSQSESKFASPYVVGIRHRVGSAGAVGVCVDD